MKIHNLKDHIEAAELFNSKIEYTRSFDRLHYSPSFIKSWMQCPSKCVYGLLFESKSPALKIGSAVHAALEEHYKDGTSEDDLLKKCTPEELEMDPFDVAKVKEYLRSYFNIRDYSNSSVSASLTEAEIIEKVSPLNVSIPVPLKGFLDRVDLRQDGMYVIDYKTASRQITPEMYINQMIIYKWLLEEQTGEKVKDVYIAAIYKDHSEYIKQDITLRNQSELIDNIFELDQEVIDSMEERVFIKREGDHCRFCPMKDKCKDSLTLDIKE